MLAIPDRGVLVVEVKGGAIEVRDGVWLQNGRAMDRVPRDQAHTFARLLRKKLDERYDGPKPYFAIATAFPDTPFGREPTHGDTEHALIGQQDLGALAPALESIVRAVFPREGPWAKPPRDSGWIDALHGIWGETWSPRLALGDRARLRERELVALDAAQLSVLDMIRHNPRFLVRGGPGTGKTLLARDVYAQAEKAGMRALYLCWTRALATALRAEGVESACTVRETAAQLLSDAGIAMQQGAAPSAWTNETWELATLQAAADAVPMLDARWGAVVVDEAQDLSATDWELVKALAGDGSLWAFGDSGQAFWPDRAVPAGLFPASLELRSRYRCPESLSAFADSYRPDAPSVVEERAVVNTVLRVVRAPSPTAVADRVARELDKALGDGARPEDIAILSLAGQSRTKVCATSRIGRTPVVRADDATAPSQTVADTFLRFKGLERPWVIVTELGLAQGRAQYATRMHIALTRATVGSVVVATAEEIAADARLTALLEARDPGP